MTRPVLMTALAISLAGCGAPTTPEQQFLNDAMTALGGRSRIETVKTLTIEGEGVNYNLGQDMKPEASTQQFAVSSYKRQIDIVNGRQRVEQIRTPKFLYFQGPQPQTQILALDGEVAFNVSPKGEATRATVLAETDRRHDLYHHPLQLLRSTLDPKTTIAGIRGTGNARQADIKTAAGPVLTLTLDAAGVPLSISSKAYHANLGDVVMTTTFGDWQDVSGFKLPGRFTTKVDDFTTSEISATRQTVDVEMADLAAPAAVTAARPAPAAPNVTAEPIGKNLWLLGGQSHHSVLAEFSDHLVLIDAPQSEARTLAVIARAKQLVPNKPLTELVTTHHHFDHTAGLRAAIAEGMTVITHAGNQEWAERMAKRSHSMQPDTLSKNASNLRVVGVDDTHEITDQLNTMAVYHVAGNPHSDTMLMAYFPRARVLVEVDAYSPGGTYHPYAANLLENIQKRKLAVDKIVPLHGASGPFAELVKVTKGN